MNHRQALLETRIRLTLGIGLALASLICTLLSLIKGLAQQPSAASWARELADRTGAQQGIWAWTPTPDLQQWLSSSNLAFLALYWAFFLGLAFIASARQLGKNAANAGGPEQAGAAGQDLGHGSATEPPIRRPSLFTQVHQLYVAPILTSLIAGLLLKWIFEF